jgi:hypothetical protein
MGKISRPVRDTTKTCISDERRTMGIVAPNIEPFVKDSLPEIKEYTIKGKITDDLGEPIPFAAIDPGEGKALFADKNGEFQLKQSGQLKKITLTISSRGFETKQMVILDYKEPVQVSLKRNSEGIDVTSSPVYFMGVITVANPGKIQKDTTDYSTDQIIQRDIIVPDKLNKFYVFPNPVKSGGFIGLGVQMLEAGTYDCQFLDLSGKLLMQKDISIDPESRLMNIDAPRVPSGSYLFVLVNKKSGKKYSEKIVIQ